MITFKELRWSDAFSYGKDNVLKLDSSPLTQIVGKNGHGKSSIALIIEEVLFNTNSKKIKKADILNRYSKSKNYTIELDFDKDGTQYTVSTSRTNSSSTVKLLKNGEDISNHTATGTYKTIEHILGYDHKTFSQIVYQSSVSSLEFLTATDTARKKFLIELLNLSKYTKAGEVFKELASSTSKALEVAQAKVNTVSNWIKRYEKENLELLPIKDEPAPPTEEIKEAEQLVEQLANIDNITKKILQNNKYREVFQNMEVPVWPGFEPKRDDFYNEAKLNLLKVTQELKEGSSLASKCKGPVVKCNACGQDVDNHTMFNMAQEFENKRADLEKHRDNLADTIAKFEDTEKKYNQYLAKVAEYEKYAGLYDPNMSSEVPDKQTLNKRVGILTTVISTTNAAIEDIRRRNKAALEHNAKVELIKKQMEEMRAELAENSASVISLTEELSNYQVLVKAFSTTGLVAYKIECLVKDLEEVTNNYLTNLADGRFQLGFQITSSDKLNVVITDNGNDIDINALSSGERARVNVAALLGIRGLMQSLSNSRTNLLILDETVENLDAEGKEKLIEVLLEEESLNTFLISHGFTHPLLEKLHVVKKNNVSRLDT